MVRLGLGRRIAILAVLFAAELTLVSLYFDGANLGRNPGAVTGQLRTWGATVLRFAIALAALLVTFSYLGKRTELDALSARVSGKPVRLWLLAAHVGAFGLFVALGQALYSGQPLGAAAPLVACGFLGTAFAVVCCAALAVLPFTFWVELARIPGALWAYSGAASILVVLLTAASRSLWQPASELTFQLVQILLRPLIPQITVQPERMRILTGRYNAIISPECSGLEGIGLLLLFGVFWLWVFRKECRFPQALALLPAGLVLLFLLNSVRIAALILIGHAGARQIATQGFHSQAGWISFNAVAFGLCVAARRVRWVRSAEPELREASVGVNPVAPYLMPFLAILAAGMASRAMTGSFEWLYPLRLFAAAAAFWVYRREYAKLDWRAGWSGPAAGVFVFVVWVSLERLFSSSAGGAPMPAALGGAGDAVRALWIGARVLSAVVAVPLAEELAFRGFLIRRFVSSDFESLPMKSFSWLGLVFSSILFGALHGERWLAGSLAGLIYGLVLIRRGKLGDAVVAHATTNALLAGEVLLFGAWQYW